MNTHTALHLSETTRPPVGHATEAGAWVELNGGDVTIFADRPADLVLLAECLTDTARRLSDRLDREAARAVNAETAA